MSPLEQLRAFYQKNLHWIEPLVAGAILGGLLVVAYYKLTAWSL